MAVLAVVVIWVGRLLVVLLILRLRLEPGHLLRELITGIFLLLLQKLLLVLVLNGLGFCGSGYLDSLGLELGLGLRLGLGLLYFKITVLHVFATYFDKLSSKTEQISHLTSNENVIINLNFHVRPDFNLVTLLFLMDSI